MTESPDDEAVLNELLTNDETRVTCQLAYWLNLARVDERLSRTPEATRSTMLWSLMITDTGVASAFAAGGVELDQWTRLLGLSSDPVDLRRKLESTYEGERPTPAFHPDLLGAFERHLPSRRSDDRRVPTAPQLALAILEFGSKPGTHRNCQAVWINSTSTGRSRCEDSKRRPTPGRFISMTSPPTSAR